MCSELDNYDIQIDAECYNNDYDNVDFENQFELSEKPSDILFE